MNRQQLVTDQSIGDIEVMATSFTRALRAENLSPRTIETYLEACHGFAAFLTEKQMPRAVSSITREHVEAFMEHLLQTRKPATASNRYRALSRFFGFLLDEGEISRSPMANMKPPKVPVAPPPHLTEAQVLAILKACNGNGFEERRDAAIISAFASTGARLSEITYLRLEDVDLDAGVATLVRTKGSRPRVVPLAPKTIRAIDRYLRSRSSHSAAGSDRLWLGRRGPLTPNGVRQAVQHRAEQAGVKDLHPHLFRHAFSHNWLAQGGSETGLMSITGWTSRQMLARYAAATASERAIAEARRLSLEP